MKVSKQPLQVVKVKLEKARRKMGLLKAEGCNHHLCWIMDFISLSLDSSQSKSSCSSPYIKFILPLVCGDSVAIVSESVKQDHNFNLRSLPGPTFGPSSICCMNLGNFTPLPLGYSTCKIENIIVELS